MCATSDCHCNTAFTQYASVDFNRFGLFSHGFPRAHNKSRPPRSPVWLRRRAAAVKQYQTTRKIRGGRRSSATACEYIHHELWRTAFYGPVAQYCTITGSGRQHGRSSFSIRPTAAVFPNLFDLLPKTKSHPPPESRTGKNIFPQKCSLVSVTWPIIREQMTNNNQ